MGEEGVSGTSMKRGTSVVSLKRLCAVRESSQNRQTGLKKRQEGGIGGG